MQNWGGNVDYGDRRILAPKTLEGLAEAIQENQVRPIGTMHSFSDVALGDGLLLSAAGLPF